MEWRVLEWLPYDCLCNTMYKVQCWKYVQFEKGAASLLHPTSMKYDLKCILTCEKMRHLTEMKQKCNSWHTKSSLDNCWPSIVFKTFAFPGAWVRVFHPELLLVVFFVKSSSPVGGLLDRLFENLLACSIKPMTSRFHTCHAKTQFSIWRTIFLIKTHSRYFWRKLFKIMGSAGIWTRDHLHPKQVSYP